MDDYAELLHQLRNRYYAEPAIAQKAADAITALLAERDAAIAENEKLRDQVKTLSKFHHDGLEGGSVWHPHDE